MTKTPIYKREVVHYPYRHWIEYYTDKTLADMAYDAADASIGLYVHQKDTVYVSDVDTYFYGRLSFANDYNNSADEIRRKVAEIDV